ncbi:hypothetical protein HZY88_02695 [Aerococcaceae bacterium DSM 111176]|nr:hypothetical protein [Aerococcaceae bacterium DSM 111176]
MAERKLNRLIGYLIGSFILLGFLFLFILIFTQIHREGLMGYIFHWLMGIYLVALSIGLLMNLVRNWSKKKWYLKIIQPLGILLFTFMGIGYTVTAYQDLPYVDQPEYVELRNLEIDADYSGESHDFILLGNSSSGAEFKFYLNSTHYNQALGLQEHGELETANVFYLPNSNIVMALAYNQP